MIRPVFLFFCFFCFFFFLEGGHSGIKKGKEGLSSSPHY